ncbi:hypothetical protein L1987_20361 [Smallanthus sonchifolius]|uniref:Uncharacterized protein n=1 Tax=Smallanthus sonchifolius TaxID=185202 RepID=A0ACB9IS22_9ASTR|nr:hypothetical protein L1987_20361 [Smallanthus sonchifolius]
MGTVFPTDLRLLKFAGETQFSCSIANAKLESSLTDARVYMLSHPKESDATKLLDRLILFVACFLRFYQLFAFFVTLVLELNVLFCAFVPHNAEGEEMRSSSENITRIFVARIPLSVKEAAFRSHFKKYGEIMDLYMPKDPSTKGHRGIGLITFANVDFVDDLKSETHEHGSLDVVVDRATHKEDNYQYPLGTGLLVANSMLLD